MLENDKIKVLFIHGLESGPEGTKVQLMRKAGFDVQSVDMHMSALRVTKKNSVLRNVFRTQSFLYWLLATAGFIVISYYRNLSWQYILILFMGGNIIIYFFIKNLLAEAWQKSIEACLTLQLEPLKEFGPDIIVGSSYGGAISCELIRRGLWKGPTILLAPAYVKILRSVRIVEELDHIQKLRDLSQTQPIVIFHDPADNIVDHEDSISQAKDSAIELQSPDAGGHRMLGVLESGVLYEKIRTLIPPKN